MLVDQREHVRKLDVVRRHGALGGFVVATDEPADDLGPNRALAVALDRDARVDVKGEEEEAVNPGPSGLERGLHERHADNARVESTVEAQAASRVLVGLLGPEARVVYLAQGEQHSRIGEPSLPRVFDERRPDPSSAELRPDGEVRKEQDTLIRVDLADDAAEHPVTRPECDGSEQPRPRLTAELPSHRLSVVELVRRKGHGEDFPVEPVEELEIMVHVEVAECDHVGRTAHLRRRTRMRIPAPIATVITIKMTISIQAHVRASTL
jgi:hypothetical protein